MSVAFDEAWGFMKALPEQQQYQEMPGLGEGFEQMTPQRRIGTVHPAIISMLRRLQSGKGPGPTRPGIRSVGYDPMFTDDRPMPNLKTFRADPLQDMKGINLPSRSKIKRKYLSDEIVGDRDIPRAIRESRPFGHLVEMPSRRAFPGFETYGNETGMSPQFVDPSIGEPFVEGYSKTNTSGGNVAGRIDDSALYPDVGSPQEVIDEMARQAPEASAQAAAGEIDYGGPTLDEYAASLTGPNPRNRLASRLDELTRRR